MYFCIKKRFLSGLPPLEPPQAPAALGDDAEEENEALLHVDAVAGEQLDMLHTHLPMELSDPDSSDGEPPGGGAARGRRPGPGPPRSALSLMHHGGPARRPQQPVVAGPSSGVQDRPQATVRGAPEFVARRDYRSSWPKFFHSITPYGSKNYLRLSQTAGMEHSDLKAVCAEHAGSVCGLSRSCRNNRPIGYLWWWLGQGRGLTKEQHSELGRAGPTFAQRHAARQAFERLDGNDEFLAADAGGADQGEPPQ